MNKIWNELSEESKNIVLSEYKELKEKIKELPDNNSIKHHYIHRADELEIIFGKDNLNPKPQIKTWEDYEKTLSKDHIDNIKESFGDICLLPRMSMGGNPIVKKMIATYQIFVLIELGYGGMITDEEWANDSVYKYVITPANNDELCFSMHQYTRTLIAFHTIEQRDEFYRNNKQLCKDYYMITT